MNKNKQQKRNKPGSLILLWLDTMAHLLIAISVLYFYGTKIADMSLIVNLTLSVSMIYYAFKPTVDWFRRLYGR